MPAAPRRPQNANRRFEFNFIHNAIDDRYFWQIHVFDRLGRSARRRHRFENDGWLHACFPSVTAWRIISTTRGMPISP